MSDYLSRIVYLSNAEYDTLADGQSITKNGVTLSGLDSNTLYFTPEEGAGISLSSQSAQIYLCGATSTNSTDLQLSSAYITTDGYLTATRVYNAVWNDYAEYRKSLNKIQYGRCVKDNDNGTVEMTQARLIPGAQVVSDTWGHIMGATKEAQTPVAVAGRVLVYPFKNRYEYHAGMAVCSAPNGTVDIMSREEIQAYPDCIVGIVSEIPEYDTWGTDNVLVDGRIWIKVR